MSCSVLQKTASSGAFFKGFKEMFMGQAKIVNFAPHEEIVTK